MDFWTGLDELLLGREVVVERPKGSRHPSWPDAVYPLDHGYLEDTTSSDGGEIDVWIGSRERAGITGVICTADPKKKDLELKILLDCSEDGMKEIGAFHDQGMVGPLAKRPC